MSDDVEEIDALARSDLVTRKRSLPDSHDDLNIAKRRNRNWKSFRSTRWKSPRPASC